MILLLQHAPPCPANFFVFLIESGFHCVGQAGLELLISSDLLTLASIVLFIANGLNQSGQKTVIRFFLVNFGSFL